MNTKIISLANLTLFLLLCSAPLTAGHRRYFRSADDINTGTLDPLRVNPDTFTLQGNSVDLQELFGTVQGISISTTQSFFLRSSGDMFLSTNPGINSSHFYTFTGTFNITNAIGYQLLASTPGYLTCTSTYAIVVSTDRLGYGITWKGIDDSSWTVKYSSSVNLEGAHRPTMVGNSGASRILAWSHLYMFAMTDHQVCGGLSPGGEWGVQIIGNWEP